MITFKLFVNSAAIAAGGYTGYILANTVLLVVSSQTSEALLKNIKKNLSEAADSV